MGDIKIKKITPMFDHIILTMERKTVPQVVNGIIMPDKIKGGINEFQKVIAVGSFVKTAKPGDLVCFNPSAYGRPVQEKDANSIMSKTEGYHVKMEYNFPTVEIDGKPYLYIAERDIDFIINEYDEVEDEPTSTSSIITQSPLIV